MIVLWQSGRIFRRRHGRRVLVTFVGTFDKHLNQTTLGDVMAAYNIARCLRGGVSDIRIGWSGHFFDLDNLKNCPRDVYDAQADTVVYVCGPIHDGLAPFIEKFARPRRVAVGVSIPRGYDYSNTFDAVHIRDSESACSFDLALANVGYPHLRADSRHRAVEVATCLVGPQGEYGDLDGSARAHELVSEGVGGYSHVSVQTLLRGDLANPYWAELDLQCARVLITTRLHGALIGLFHCVPVIAIDQIKGGAKVTRMMNSIGHPVFNAWTATAIEIRTELGRLLANGRAQGANGYRRRIIRKSRQALHAAIRTILADSGSSRDPI